MSSTAAAWALAAGILTLLSTRRAVWAVALYMLTFYAAPHLWWWGDDLPSLRYSFISGFVLLGAVIWHRARTVGMDGPRFGFVHAMALLMAVNGTLVHFVFALSPAVSMEGYIELLKFVLLFFLLWSAVTSKEDFRIALLAIALGAAYIGYEVTINGRGDFSGSRLEGVGAPGADAANSLACLMLVSLPLAGSLFLGSSWKNKLVVAVSAPLILNVLLLCNSRGGFIALIGTGVAFLLLARGASRKVAIRTLVLGSIALYILLGDPKILDRFTTTFVGSEERDNSASSRFDFWRAGILMMADYPLGAGGGAFKYVAGNVYLAQVGSTEADRSLHNGFLTEGTDWGVQGLALKLLFIGSAMAAAYRTSNRCRLAGRAEESVIGLCLVVAEIGLLIASLFGSFLANEWGYWLVALLARYSTTYEVRQESVAREERPAPAVLRELPLGAQ